MPRSVEEQKVVIYIPTPPSAPEGVTQNDKVIWYNTRAECEQFFRDCCPVAVKDANTASVDWKANWITTVDTDTDLA
jgi:hypothetical protein